MDTIDLAVVGGGVVGLSAAYHWGKRFPGQTVVAFDKNRFLGEEQSGRNSGVIHSGYQYPKDSLKSRLCLLANPRLKAFAAEHDIPHATVGKLIVATQEKELPLMQRLYRAAKEKGVAIDYLNSQEIKRLEPNVHSLEGLYTKHTGIIDAATYVRKLAQAVERQEGVVLKHAKVEKVIPEGHDFILQINQDGEEYEARAGLLINAAGLFADQIGRQINPEFPYEIHPLRGEFMKINKKSRPELWMNGINVYPVPQPIPGMYDQWGNPKTMAGVHLTPTFSLAADGTAYVGNTVLVGPLSHLIESRSDYRQNRRGAEEFHARVAPIFPSLQIEDLEEDQAGIQVKIKGYDDYVLQRDTLHPNAVHAICDSPGMTSSLVIGDYLVNDVLREGKV